MRHILKDPQHVAHRGEFLGGNQTQFKLLLNQKKYTEFIWSIILETRIQLLHLVANLNK